MTYNTSIFFPIKQNETKKNSMLSAKKLHSVACRHCNKIKVTCGKKTYAMALFQTHRKKTFLKQIESIEQKTQTFDDITFFCEQCKKISVFSFSYYKNKRKVRIFFYFYVFTHFMIVIYRCSMIQNLLGTQRLR